MAKKGIKEQADAILNKGKNQGQEKKKSSIIVIYWIHTLKDQDLAGQTPKQVRELLEDTLNIDSRAECFVNGKEVDEDEYVMEDKDRLEFSRQSGSKGM